MMGGPEWDEMEELISWSHGSSDKYLEQSNSWGPEQS